MERVRKEADPREIKLRISLTPTSVAMGRDQVTFALHLWKSVTLAKEPFVAEEWPFPDQGHQFLLDSNLASSMPATAGS